MNLIHLPKNARTLVSRTQDAIEQSVQIKTDRNWLNHPGSG